MDFSILTLLTIYFSFLLIIEVVMFVVYTADVLYICQYLQPYTLPSFSFCPQINLMLCNAYDLTWDNLLPETPILCA